MGACLYNPVLHLNAMCCIRTDPLSAVTIPVLELHGSGVVLKYLSADDADGRDANAPAEVADLPTGFRELWLRAKEVHVARTERAGGAPVSGVDIADELCRYMAFSPNSYRVFRLYEHKIEESYFTAAYAPYMTLSQKGSNGLCSCAGRFDSMRDVATAMQRFEATHGLTVSMSDDQTYVLIVRGEQ